MPPAGFRSLPVAVGLLGFWAMTSGGHARPARADVLFANKDCTDEARDTVRKAFAWGRDLADRGGRLHEPPGR